LGFFNKMLNTNDKQGNYIVQDYRNIVGKALLNLDEAKDSRQYQLTKIKAGMHTLLYKILTDNFEDQGDAGEKMIKTLFECLSSQINVGAKSSEKTFKEQVEEHFIEISQMSDEDKKDEIVDTMDSAYPEQVVEDKQGSLREWVDKCYTYLKYTMYDKKGDFKQTDLNKLLIPSLQQLIYRKLTNDDTIGKDDVKAQLMEISNFWQEFEKKEGLDKIKADKDEVQRALYGGTISELKKEKSDAVKVTNSEDSIFGAGSYMTSDVSKSKAFNKSLYFKITLKQREDIVASLKEFTKFVPQRSGPNKAMTYFLVTSPNYVSYITYIKSQPKVLKLVQDQIDIFKKSNNPDVVAQGNEMQKLIK